MSNADERIGVALNYLNAVDLKLEALLEAQRREAALRFLESRLAFGLRADVPADAAFVSEPLPHSLDGQFSRLRELAPTNFDLWLDRFKAGELEYQKCNRASLSLIDHPEAFHFGQFITLHGRGTILDLGVGPLAVPVYLAKWPIQRLAGLDPLGAWETHPFPFAQSVAEFIPWPDSSFDTVVAATSLDHIYLLDRAFAEVRRVLKPKGRFIVWSAIFHSTTPYDPYSALIEPPDEFHLFHPGENWFHDALSAHFRLIERLDVSRVGFNNSYLAYEML
jgi:SAM-dependent methyltransferase